MMTCAIPDAHPRSTLRAANGVLENGGGTMTKKNVNHKTIVLADLSTCNYLLDNLPGRRWAEWRRESGDAFKEALAERVEQVRSCIREEEEEKQEEEGDEQTTETKSSVLEKSLRTIGIFGSVRVDETSGKGSIIDVIKLLCPGATGDYAKTALARVISQDDTDHFDPTSIRSRVDYIQINGKGRTTPVSDAKTIAEIIWLLPSRAAKEFRRQSAETICRVLAGDTSICEEIEARCARLQGSDQGRAFQHFMTGGGSDGPPAKKARIGPDVMELATAEQYQSFVSSQVQHEVDEARHQQTLRQVKNEVSLVMAFKEAYEQIRPLDCRAKMELCDRITDIQNRTFRRDAVMAANTDAMVMATPVSPPADPGTSVPTPDCHAAVRGHEISIAMVSSELGVRLGGKAGLVGRRMKALYAERYGGVAATNIPKRQTIYMGRPYQENTYFSRDKDIMEQSIREVAGGIDVGAVATI